MLAFKGLDWSLRNWMEVIFGSDTQPLVVVRSSGDSGNVEEVVIFPSHFTSQAREARLTVASQVQSNIYLQSF